MTPSNLVCLITCNFSIKPSITISGGKSQVLETLNFIILVFFSFILIKFSEEKVLRLSSCSCIGLFSAKSICRVLSLNASGLGLLTGSGVSDSFRLMAMRRLRSSIYFSERDDGLGMSGLRRAPLNLMMNNKIPSSAPCGVDPGKCLLDEHDPLYLINIDLSVKYEMRMMRSQPGRCMAARSSITN